MSERLPNVFVGCSSEAIRIAEAIRNNLSLKNIGFIKIWQQNFVEPSHYVEEDLIQKAPTFDFAIFVLSPDDDVTSRGVEKKAPRDNVIYELGLFMGVLGRERVFLVKHKNPNLKMPTDVTGVTPIDYIMPPAGSDDYEAALGAPSSMIENAVRKRGVRASTQELIKTSEEQYQLAAQYFDSFLKEKYGVSAVSDSSILTITDYEGSAVIRRACHGLKISGGITMGRIAEKVQAPTPGSKIVRQPYFVKEIEFGKRVYLDVKPPSGETFSEFDIVIDTPLSQWDRSLDYEYAVEIYKFCLMTREEVIKAYPTGFNYEYASLKIAMPTDQALVEVEFPEHYAARTFPAVFIGDSESTHESELSRASGGFERTGKGARFIIDKPIVGFTYLIYWVSPTQKDFDKMRLSQ